jgi:prepilin-type N-terminal cleavage/methylation domain-containing protein
MPLARRRGFSYVEMLIVVAVIGVLVALLLPAVQAVREFARRENCARNLTQLITAIQNYEFHHGVLPPGTIDSQGPILSQPVGYHHNWITQVLPFLEQKTVYRHVDFHVGVYHPSHLPVRRLEFQVLECPSMLPMGPGYSDYAGVHNDIEAPIDEDNNGVLFLNSSIRYEDIRDGATNTLFVGEKISPIGDLGWMSGTRATLRNLGTIGAGAPWSWQRTGFTVIPSDPPPGVGEGTSRDRALSDQRLLDHLLTADANVAVGPNGKLYVARRPKDARLAVGGFGSVHPGGSNFACGDGSIRFVAVTVDRRVMTAMAHRADGELLSNTDY